MNTWYNINEENNEFFIEKLSRESILWYTFLKLIITDIKYWQSLLNTNFKTSNTSDKQIPQQQLKDCANETSELINLLYKHASGIEKIIECDEVECEDFYLGKHATLFRRIENTLIEFYNLKLKIRNCIPNSSDAFSVYKNRKKSVI